MAPSITYESVKFDQLVVEYKDLKIYKPTLFFGALEDWCYLGPTAVSSDKAGDQTGLIVKANVPNALTDVKDWEQVFIDIEGRQFSTWRGIAPEGYVVIGHFFVTGDKKPTPEQTAGIKAIRKDLISEREPNHLIWSLHLPFAYPTLWDVSVSDFLHVPTGAFVSKNGESSVGLLIGLLNYKDAEAQKAW